MATATKSKVKVHPLADRVAIRPLEETETMRGGLYIPDTAKEKPQQGEIIAVGNGKVLENGEIRTLDVKKGDQILFGKYSGNEVKVDGVEYLVMREDDIMGVIE